MGKIHLYIWNILAIGMLLLGVFLLISIDQFDGKGLLPTLIGVAFGIAAAITIFLLRDNPEKSAKFLLTVWMGILTAAGIAGMMLFWGVTRHLSEKLIMASLIVGLATFLVFTILTRKKLLPGIIITVVVLCATFYTVHSISGQQIQKVEDTAKLWQEKGWPVEAGEISPDPVTHDLCKNWFDLMSFENDEDLELFLKEEIGKLTEDIGEALATGGSVREVIRASTITTHPQWEIVASRNTEIVNAMNECPYVQWFDWEEYKNNPWDAPIPNLLHTIRWSRGMLVHSLITAEEGNYEEAANMCQSIYDAGDKFHIRGQTLINSLIAIAMKKMAAVGFAGIQSMSARPWQADIAERLDTNTAVDPDWAKGLYDSERYNIFTVYESCPSGIFSSLQGKDELIPSWNPLERAYLKQHTEHDLDLLTDLTEWIRTVPDFSRGKFSWHEGHTNMTALGGGYFLPSFTNSYARLVVMTAQLRSVVAVNQIMQHYRSKRTLPKSAEVFGDTWPIDPFDDQPLRYKKVSKRDFIVYSIGPDEKDQGGEPLYTYGIVETESEQDMGFYISLK